METQISRERIGESLNVLLFSIGLSMDVRVVDLEYDIQFRSVAVKKEKVPRKFLGIPFQKTLKTEVAEFYLLEENPSKKIFVIEVSKGEFAEQLKGVTKKLEKDLHIPTRFIH